MGAVRQDDESAKAFWRAMGYPRKKMFPVGPGEYTMRTQMLSKPRGRRGGVDRLRCDPPTKRRGRGGILALSILRHICWSTKRRQEVGGGIEPLPKKTYSPPPPPGPHGVGLHILSPTYICVPLPLKISLSYSV